MTTKTTPKPRTCKPAAKPVQRHGSPGATGRLTAAETRNLLLQAQEAFHHQTVLRQIEPGTTFDAWRRDQVQDICGKPGLSKIDRSDWRTVKAHFLTLSGREDEAFTLLNQTGTKAYRPTDSFDTWETCETYAALIHSALAAHADFPPEKLTTSKGHIHTGWFLAAARQRTQKPTLTMATLAERLDPKTLHGLLSHLKNHIANREGRADKTLRSPRQTQPLDTDSNDPF
jgi:hypothetical protein